VARVRVAVLEEQTLFRKSLCHTIDRDARFQVVCDARETEGIDAIVRSRPDVVLIDVDFRNGDAVDAAVAIKAKAPGARICFMALEPRPELVTRALNMHAIDAFILKDIGTWELCTALLATSNGETYVDPRVAGLMLRELNALKSAHSKVDRLSERECDVVRLIAQGLSNKEISSRLILSEKTIKNHISRIFAKLNVTARTQAAVHAIKVGIA
jgi:two-component system, NarL family, response regulator DegU